MAGEMAVLGDPPGTDHSDESGYAGPLDTSMVSMDYYRTKVREFQAVLTALDEGYQALQALQYTEAALIPEIADAITYQMQEYENKRGTLVATAEAINLGAAAINSMGGRMPPLQLPGTLGALPLAIPIAAVAAIATAAVLISWGQAWIASNQTMLTNAQAIELQTTPEAKAAVAVALAKQNQAAQIAQSSGALGSLSNYAKWGVVALGGFLVWKYVVPEVQKRWG